MNINNISQVALVNSAVYVRVDLQNEFPAYFPPAKNTRVRLQLTTFDISTLGVEENVNVHTMDSVRVSKNDKQITFKIDNVVV